LTTSEVLRDLEALEARMSDTERGAMIETFRGGPARVRLACEGVSRELMDWRPFAEAWTIHENIPHLSDAEVASYSRHRKALAEPGVRVDMWDEIKWHATLGYETIDPAAGLALFESLRLATAALLARFAQSDWSGYRIEHPVRGVMKLEDIVRFFVDHDTFHVDLIERNKRLYREQGTGARR
jgi:hypothetical protein